MRAGHFIRQLWVGALVLSACNDAPAGDDEAGCVGAKCDDPEASTTALTGDEGSSSDDGGTTGDDPVATACWDRRAEAFNPNQLSFTRDALRWSCADIDSTPSVDRGQEYCEYFAIASLPPTPSEPYPEPQVLGRNLGVDPADGQTPLPLELSGEQIAALEGAADSVVAACVFSSWNADIDAPCGDACEVEDVLGVPVDTDTFRMKFDPNTNEAALALIDDCMGLLPTAGDPTDPDDPFNDPFYRACELNADINETQHRKSDNVICAASVRLAECGCALADGSPVDAGLAPPSELGFRLGTWSGVDALPAGCRFHDVVLGAQTLVVCDLTGAEVLQNAAELKSYCRERYAPDVVVHVDIPAAQVVCDPPAGEPYADACPSYPWVLAP
ncbi:MAG: hypothetical protein IAG13_34210 [Deltaproteobacteria bacterium]|nr:hypothetical protein [Nannocystaceae bacterium]